ncbi:MAG: sigma-70 family RNA polymerase sigma factor [Clostridia bacterium]|nr:sigma-70 family RNA polymerase sigma factor [Clostridia bacterium]
MKEFEKIYERYFGDVFRYIRRLSGSEQIAEEITSETFFKALRSIDKFRGDCDVRVWLCQIAKNCYYTYVKKRNRMKSVEDVELATFSDSTASPAEEVARREEIREIRHILHTMKEPYKEVFTWRVFAELSFQEIGRIFGKSENWACVTYHRARKMIKEKMEENNREEGM